MKLIPVTYYGFTAMDRRFSSPMLPWIVSEIRKRDYNEKLSLGIEDGILQAYNPDFELQFSHKTYQIMRFSQADQDPTTFLYLMRDDSDILIYCYLFQAKKKDDVMHVIDDVLDPMMLHQWPQPTAIDFMAHSTNWAIGKQHMSTLNFFEKVIFWKQTALFEQSGGHTYFIPVEFDHFRLEQIDRYIIQGHVILNQVLFTRPTEKEFFFETAANGDYIYIVLSFIELNQKFFIKSSTVLGDSNHKKGDLFVEIVKSDIPVKNGVVHLINRPLAVFDRQLKPFPFLSIYYKMVADPELNITYNLGEFNGINQMLKNNKDGKRFTYFVPNDSIWRKIQNGGDSGNRHYWENILKRHLIIEKKTSFSMKYLKDHSGMNLTSLDGLVHFEIGENQNGYYLKWKGRQIQILRPDYECEDGLVHVVDGIFGELLVGERETQEPFSFWKMLKRTFT